MKKYVHIIKPEFPIMELTLLGAMFFIIGIISIQILKGGEGYFVVYPLPIIGLILGYFFTNYRNKKLERNGTDLIIKPFFKKSRVYNSKNIKGYEIYETFDRTGLVKQIRLLDLNGRKIVFVRDSYNDYDKLIQLIKNCGFKFIGEREIKWKYKQQYGIFVSISFILAISLFFLLKLIENE